MFLSLRFIVKNNCIVPLNFMCVFINYKRFYMNFNMFVLFEWNTEQKGFDFFMKTPVIALFIQKYFLYTLYAIYVMV